MMKNSVFLMIIFLLYMPLKGFSQEKKKIIDFEDHLNTQQVNNIENLIKESGVNISIVFYNVNEILGFKLKEPRSVHEYINVWKEKNKDAVLVLFSNRETEPVNFWEDNLQIVSNISDLDISSVKTSIINEFEGLAYDTKDDASKERFYLLIQNIIGFIANIKNKVVGNITGSPDFGAGFKFPQSFTPITNVNENEGFIKQEEEKLKLKFKIKKEFASYAKIKVYCAPNKLVYEKEINVGADAFEWDGTMNVDPYKGFITRDICSYKEGEADYKLKIEIEAKKTESSLLKYRSHIFSEVNKDIKDFLDVLMKYPEFHNNLDIKRDNERKLPETKNQFRKYLALKPIYIKSFNKEEIPSDNPLKYFAENVITGYYFCSIDPMLYRMTVHKEFKNLVDLLGIDFSNKYISLGGLSMRYNVNKPDQQAISNHGFGIAFDVSTIENPNINSASNFFKPFFAYLHALTNVKTSGERPSVEDTYTACAILRKCTNTRTGIIPPSEKEKEKFTSFDFSHFNNLYIEIANNFKVIQNMDIPALITFFDSDLGKANFKSALDKTKQVYQTGQGQAEAKELCTNFLNQYNPVLYKLKTSGNVKDILDAFNNAFFMKERGFHIGNANAYPDIIFDNLNFMTKAIKACADYLNGNGLTPITYFSSVLLEVKQESYRKELNEIKRIVDILNGEYPDINFGILKDKFTAYAETIDMKYRMAYGFTTISLDDLEQWHKYKFLYWAGQNRDSKDGMHFELRLEYYGDLFNLGAQAFIYKYKN